MNGSPLYARKVIKEVIFVVTRVVVQEFMDADQDCELLLVIL